MVGIADNPYINCFKLSKSASLNFATENRKQTNCRQLAYSEKLGILLSAKTHVKLKFVEATQPHLRRVANQAQFNYSAAVSAFGVDSATPASTASTLTSSISSLVSVGNTASIAAASAPPAARFLRDS
jgi:hypothetical protein